MKKIILIYPISLLFILLVSCSSNSTPTFQFPDIEAQTFIISEKSITGSYVGTIGVENSTDSHISYYLVKSENSEPFHINHSGIISVLKPEMLNYDENPEFGFEVMVAFITEADTLAVFTDVNIILIKEPENYSIQISTSTGNSYDGYISSLSPSKNYQNSHYLFIETWTVNLEKNIRRAFLHFDLSALPDDIQIEKAMLYLFNPDDGIEQHMHSQLTQANEIVISPVSAFWNKEIITWDNQPSFSDKLFVEIPASATNRQNYEIDITEIIIEEYPNQSNYNGLALRMKEEDYYKRICFASMSYPDSTLHPTLTINYLK